MLPAFLYSPTSAAGLLIFPKHTFSVGASMHGRLSRLGGANPRGKCQPHATLTSAPPSHKSLHPRTSSRVIPALFSAVIPVIFTAIGKDLVLGMIASMIAAIVVRAFLTDAPSPEDILKAAPPRSYSKFFCCPLCCLIFVARGQT